MTATDAKIVAIPSRRRNSAAVDDLRERVLAAAIRAFARDGYEGASLPRIADDADTRHTNILYHFGSKEGLWREAVDHAFSDERDRLLAIAQTAKDLEPIGIFKVMVRATVQFAHRHPAHFAIVVQECQAPSNRFDWLFEQHLSAIHEQFDRVAQSAVFRGQMKPVGAAYLGLTLLGAINSFFALRPLVERLYGVDPAQEAEALAHADSLVETIFHGIEIKQGKAE